jgi:hypothetical protein
MGFTGLQTQDSLGLTRARLAKQRRNESLTVLDQIKRMEVRLPPPTYVRACFSLEEHTTQRRKGSLTGSSTWMWVLSATCTQLSPQQLAFERTI